jgi:SNF2 family DNA or RNA helicase
MWESFFLQNNIESIKKDLELVNMGISDFVNSFKRGDQKQLITCNIDPLEGIDFIFDRKILDAPEQHAMSYPLFGMQLAYLKGMEEQSKAKRNGNGFTILSADAVELGEDFITLFDFDEFYTGKYQARFEGNTGKASFSAAIDLVMADGSIVQKYSLHGPFLKLSDNEIYSLQPFEWRALKTFQTYQNLPPEKHGEYENNWLIFQLQIAKKSGMDIDLAHFNNLEILSPDTVGVSVESLPSGDLILSPSFGSGVNIDDITARLGQISGSSDQCIFRVKDKFVLLDQKRLEATTEILTNNKIPKEQVADFLKSPTRYLDGALIDLDTGFSIRVHGAERFSHRYFGDIEKSGVDWFSKASNVIEAPELLGDIIDSDYKLKEIEELIHDAKKTGAQILEVDERTFDISDDDKVNETITSIRADIENGSFKDKSLEDNIPDTAEKTLMDKAVIAIDSNDDSIGFSNDARVSWLKLSGQSFARDNLKRDPFPHQEEGVNWILAHLDEIKTNEAIGALLADDMGLGKTYMALVAIAEWYKRRKVKNLSLKPTLIIAPLSLLENWQAEVDETFKKSPFTDIVVLQSAADLTQYKIKGAGRETSQEFIDSDVIENHEQIRYALKVGSNYGSGRLDQPGRLVLTTYQTLRDYQFSLSRIDWGVVTFDEAQNLKNPNTLVTPAAKGLKADFKLLATGTPVENSLKDFWCLLDTAVPGLLGAWQDFRMEYIAPILSASPETVGQVKVDVGKQLRSRVGDFMLRRTKAEKLKNLPQKRIFSGDQNATVGTYMPMLSATMSGAQLSHYDEIISTVKNSKPESKKNIILSSLRQLKVTSIHQDIAIRAPIPSSSKDLLNRANTSKKILSLLNILQEIKSREEKVLVFAETKAVQAYICALVTTIFKVQVEIINGETKAVATKKDMATRKSIIDRFQSENGFGVIVMSPVAAGVGLTVVGANNVIHLERHWNPAKEAQATDRVYRIGQKRDVNVYYPMALHPNVRSFDLQLNELLTNKIDLSDAVVASESVEASDMTGCF